MFKKIILLISTLTLASCNQTDTIKSDFSSLPLHKYSKAELEKDFDLLISSLKEAHTGLYWYSSPNEFDSIIKIQRSKIKDNLNGLEFYNIAAPIVAFTKEDHCDISLSKEIAQYLNKNGKFIPLAVINLNQKVYVLNNPSDLPAIKGWQLLAINNVPVSKIQAHIFNTFASDGFIETSKYRFLDISRFSLEYAKTVGLRETYEITVSNPETKQEKKLTLKSVSVDQLSEINRQLLKEGIIKQTNQPAKLDTEADIATLTFNTFSNSDYEDAGMNFKNFVKHAFDSIQKSGIKNLIIDMRENGGGTEGNEDYLFSFLTDKPYNKYKYVEASRFSYSFYQYTDYNKKEDFEELEADLRKEHYKNKEGRIIRKPGIETPAPLQKNSFKGKIYILTSGWTYSGGAEFCSLMKEHTNAVFIGEEVGGGFYGNTSGYSLELTLPNTGLKTDIPILKFALDVSADMPKGRGVLPDYPVIPSIKQFLKGADAEMEFTKKLIIGRNKPSFTNGNS